MTARNSTPHSLSRWMAAYLFAQAIGIVAWWLLLWRAPAVRGRFHPADSNDSMLMAFWLPDLLLAALGSAVTAVLILRGARSAAFAAAITAGAMAYAALYCVALLLAAPETWLAATTMVPAMGCTASVAWLIR